MLANAGMIAHTVLSKQGVFKFNELKIMFSYVNVHNLEMHTIM